METERVRAEREETAPTAADMKASASTDIQTPDHKTVDTRLLRLDWLVSQTGVLNGTAVVGGVVKAKSRDPASCLQLYLGLYNTQHIAIPE